MNYLKNCWYAAAWSSEITESLFARTLLEESVLMYRLSTGAVAATSNRCPHRFAPLHLGVRVGDGVQCAYHGLQFDGTGKCTLNPHGNGHISPKARLHAYPVCEKWGMVWLWPGDAEPDEALVPDLSHLEDPDLKTLSGYLPMEAHYELGVDNLIDLSHTQYVHGDRLKSEGYSAADLQVEQGEKSVTTRIFIASGGVPPAFRALLDPAVRAVDFWMDATWTPAANIVNDIGVVLPGGRREDGLRSRGVHIVTPATARTGHYFFSHSRNHLQDDPMMDAAIREWHRVGFGQQDKPIIEAAAAMMGDEVDPIRMGAILLPTDAGAVRIRRLLRRLIELEAPAMA